MSVAKVFLLGRIGRADDLAYTQAGVARLSVSVAVNKKRGEVEETSWFRVNIWGKYAEAMAPHLSKGVQVFVDGDISVRSYQRQDGTQGTSVDVNAEQIQIVQGARESNQADTPPPY